jgi:uncharacterized protein with von Willebrand factor type A (vWA) domain
MGTEVLQSKAMEQIQYFKNQYKMQKETGQPMDDAAAGELIEQLNKQGQVQQQIDALNALNAPGGPGLTPQQAKQLAALQQQLMDLQDLIDDNTDGQEQLQNGMSDAIDSAARNAIDDVGEVRDIIEAWGLEAVNSSRRISLDKRKKAIERIRRSDRLKELTDLIGRMKKIAQQKKKQKLPDGHSIKTIEMGNQLERVAPSELMKLANPHMKKDFMQRYHQKQLMQYKKDSTKSTGRGPVVFLHDKSGSMDGTKDDWSTALALATLEVAQKEKRNYGYIPYESRVITKMVKNIPAGELDPDDIMDIAEMDTRGGTNFMAPMDEAIACFRKAAELDPN